MTRMRKLGIAALASFAVLMPSFVGPATASDAWQPGTVVLAGTNADPWVLVMPEGLVRLYYASQSGAGPVSMLTSYNQGATWLSTVDNMFWNADGVNVVKAYKVADLESYCSANNGYRAYYQSKASKHIVMATGSDGTGFNTCGEVDVAAGGETPAVDTVADPGVVQLQDGTWVMAYVGYNAATPTATSIFWATSPDGMTWTKKGLAVADASAPSLVIWDDAKVRLYFHDAKGIEHVVLSGAAFGTTPELDIANANATDPMVAKYALQWHLFYTLMSGTASAGIYAATGPTTTDTAPSPTITPAAKTPVASTAASATPTPTAATTSAAATATPTPTASTTTSASPTPSATPVATPTKTVTAQLYFVKCKSGDSIVYKTGTNPKCPAGYTQIWKDVVKS